MNDTTIAAISTAYGEAGIGIVRMSGPDSLEILKRVFVPHGANMLASDDVVKNEAVGQNDKIMNLQPRHMYYGRIRDPQSGTFLDEVLAVYMPGPNSYTGEDVAEIQCHGSVVSYKNILSLLLKEGAMPAERGEFTKRAFLNGRIDLSQAEAVIDLIKARSSKSFDTALDQLSGSLSRRVAEIRKQLLDLLVSLTVNMDYPDEDIEQLTYNKFFEGLSLIYDELSKLKASSQEGRIIREGLSVAIVGKPNVGKSSLMNELLREDRSIVTSVPGTTRDTIEEQAVIRGIPVRFIDTAGIHDSDDIVESIGIEKSKDAFNRADLLILMLDASRLMEEEDLELLHMAEGRPCIVVLNKTDLGCSVCFESDNIVEMSIKEGYGIKELEDAIERFVTGGNFRRENDILLTNVRHIRLVDQALSEISQAKDMCKAEEAMDFIEINVRAAYDYLGEIIGETAGDSVIEEVFSRFCLGK